MAVYEDYRNPKMYKLQAKKKKAYTAYSYNMQHNTGKTVQRTARASAPPGFFPFPFLSFLFFSITQNTSKHG
jgi:hypothetical protein